MPSAQQPAGQAGPSGGQPGPPGGQAAAAGPAAGRRKPDVYRSPVAIVAWWVWVAFALANLGDIAVQGRDRFAAQVAAVLLLITGVAYVAAFRPRILADDTGITIRNPLRDHQVPWGCVQSVDLGDLLQVHCAWQDGGQQTKVLYGWAVPSARRSRARAQARARRPGRAAARQSASYHQLPAEARQALTKTDAELIATALEQRAVRARAAARPGQAGPAGKADTAGQAGTAGSPGTGGRPAASWNRLAIAALVLPAVLVIVLALA